MRTFTAIALLLSSSLVFARTEREVHELRGEVVAIADGDTLTVLDANKVQHKIRLAGIDAPEKKQAFGTAARKALGDKVHRNKVRVVWNEKDRYGRILGDVYLDDRHINREIVSEGAAWWYRKYAPKDRELERAETEARNDRRGLWKDDNPEPPWQWRKQKRAKTEATTGSRKIGESGRVLLHWDWLTNWVEYRYGKPTPAETKTP